MKRSWYSYLGLVLFLAVVAQPLLADEWFTYHHDYQRTGVSSVALYETTLTRVWMYTEPVNLIFFSHPVVAYNRVLFTSTSNSAALGRIVCLNASTGDTIWSHTLPGTSTTVRGTPTVAIVDTGLATDTFVFVAGGSGGFGSFYCFDFETGDSVWATAPGGQTRFGPSVVVGDKVIFGHDSNRLVACNVKDGTVVWSRLLVGRPYMSPSASNDTIFCGTWDILGGAGGNLYAIDANTGNILTTYDPGPGVDFSSGVLVWGNNVIAVSQDTAHAGSSKMYLWRSHDISAAPETSVYNSGINLYSTPCGYVTDQGDSIVIWGQEYPGGLIKARRLSTKGTYFNILPGHDVFDVPVAIAANGLGIVGDASGKLFFFDADTSAASRSSNRVYYTKDFITPITSGAAIADGSDTVLIIAEEYGNVFGYKMVAGVRPRTNLLVNQIDMNITTIGSGADTVTLDVFQNAGNGALTYTVADTVLTALSTKVSVSPVDPMRSKLARQLTEELMVTSSNTFLGRKAARMLAQYDEVGDYQVINKASYIASNSKSYGQAAAVDWLTVTDNSGGSLAPGAAANLTLIADGTGQGRGFHNAYLLFTPTNEPDPTPYPGETTIQAPSVRLLMGFAYQDSVVTNPVLSKLVTNYGAVAFVDAAGNGDPNNFNFNGTNELYDGTIIVGNGPTHLAMDVYDHNQTGTFPDTDVVVTGLIDSTVTYTSYIDNVNLGVRVKQTTKSFQDPAKAGFTLYHLEIINTSDTLIPNFGVGVFCDWDVGSYTTNLGNMDTTYKVFYQYDNATPNMRFGIMSIPFNSGLKGYELLDNNVYVYPTADLVNDSVWAIMSRGDFNTTGAGTPDDHSMLITFSLTNLDSGATRVEEFALFGYDSTQIGTDSLAKLINATVTYVRERSKEIASLPKTYELGQNFPNPFNANTQIRFSVPKASHVKLEVYDILGRKVKTLVDENLTAGFKQVVWDGKNENGDNVASGIYFYRIKAADYLTTKKMVLLK